MVTLKVDLNTPIPIKDMKHRILTDEVNFG